jgi:phage tail sheath protein FI
MPEYLAPAVYIEEVSFRSRTIPGVSTSTTGFVGPTRFGPVGLRPGVVTSLGEFERVYGDGRQLAFSDAGPMHNYVWHAARAFFAEGGRRLHVARVFLPGSGSDDGIARARVPAGGAAKALALQARFPGAAGNFLVRITLRVGPNILEGTVDAPGICDLQSNDVVWIADADGSGDGDLYLASEDEAGRVWTFGKSRARSAADLRLQLSGTGVPSSAPLDPERGGSVRIITLDVKVLLNDGSTIAWNDLRPDPGPRRAGMPESLFARFPATPGCPTEARSLPLVITGGGTVSDGLEVLNALFAANPSLRATLESANRTDADRSVVVLLAGGDDGARPTAGSYEGDVDPATAAKTGLKSFEDIADLSVVAAPGATFGFGHGHEASATAIVSHLISHAERMRYRVAVIDSGDGLGVSEVRAMRARYDSPYAAFYYPWVRVLDPITRQEIDLPPSGFVSGIYARSEGAVYKAPANEIVSLARGLEASLDHAQQDLLNQEGINGFRYFEGHGFRLWGARTISSDSDWKYVNVRRYFAYLEQSIDRGTQWAVFEPNGDALWAHVRRVAEDFLFNEWKLGALPGDKPETAFFVRCDRSTMTQNDLDDGQLVCMVGVAPLRPAEYVIFRIGHRTADAARRHCSGGDRS